MSRSSALVWCLLAALAALAASQIDPEQALSNPPDYPVNNPGAKTTLKFGCMLPFTGDSGVKGNAAYNGIKMAMNDAADKYPAYNFLLVCKNTQCSSTNSSKAAQDL
jgi:hypothetical protein